MIEIPSHLFQLVLADPNIIRYEEAEEFIIPNLDMLSFAQFDINDAQQIRFCAELQKMRTFLAFYYMIDRFSGHQERDDWRQKMWDTYGEEMEDILANNALRPKQLSWMREAANYIQRKYPLKANLNIKWSKKYHDLLQTIIALSSENDVGYLSLEKEAQVKHIKKLKKTIVELFKHLAS